LSQFTTARDMYRIVRYCQNLSLFEDLTAVSQVTVKPVKGGSQRTIVGNNHLLQASSTYYYQPIVHSRTGLSDNDGRTCAAVARDSGYEYLVVAMGCAEKNADGESNLHYRDAKALLKWAFKQFEYKTILGKSEILASLKIEQAWDLDHINLVPAKEVATVVDSDIDGSQVIRKVTLYEKSTVAPVEQGDVFGKVELFVNVDQKIGEMDLVSSQTVGRSQLLHIWSIIRTGIGSALPFVLIGFGALLLLLIGYIILNIVHNRRRRQRLSQRKR
jgi:D-alanyl-D-alanine carboxypeptidase